MYKLVKLFLLIQVFIMPISVVTSADTVQQRRITLNVENVKLVSVLSEIRKQSGYNFIYNEKFVDGIEGISVKVENSSLEKALDETLKGTNLNYKLKNGIIVLVPKEKPQPEKKSKLVKGVVKDDKGNPLPGVTVLVKGTKSGVSTDIDGKFSVEVTSEVKSLVFSFIGMETQEVAVPKDDKELIVILQMEVGQLDEVVITGYKQTTKREATGSVGVISEEIFKNRATPVIDNIIQGQIAGVNTIQTSGRPGETAKIRIRGTNTLTGNAEPLWVVDGVPLQRDIPNISTGQIKSGDFNQIFTNGIAGINPNDIENVSILKDASAAAIYGSRASGGVIVVTTKKGKAGKMRVNYSTNFSLQLKPQRDANLMNSKEKIEWEQQLWDEFSADLFAQGYDHASIGIVGTVRSGLREYEGMTKEEQDAYLNGLKSNTTDWFGELFRNSLTQNHYLSMSGGKDEYTYYVSMGYSGNEGLVKNTDYTRYNINANINLKPTEKLNIGLKFDVAKQQSNGYSMNVDPFKYAYFANPYESPYNADGSYRPDNTYFTLIRNHDADATKYPQNGFNIFREIDQTSSVADNLNYNITADLSYRFNDKFKFTGVAAYSFTNNKTENVNGKDTYAAFMDRLFFDSQNYRTYGSITQSSANNTSYTLRGQLNYSTYLDDDNRISILAGSEIRGQKAESVFAKRYGYDPVTGNSSIPVPLPDSEFNYNQFVSFGSMVDGLSGQSITEETFASFYGSVDYFYRSKYAASFTLRTDGSNHFGSDQQFNPTWSLGASWHIDEEEFMRSIENTISSLSLKLATGYTGNTNKSVYPQLIMNYSSNFRKTYLDAFRMGYINSAPNPNLRWEKTRDYKASIDLGLFKERIKILSEVYYRKTKDAVTNVQVAQTTGFSTQGYNTSEIENKGIEFTLNTINIDRNGFKWTTSINMAKNFNKLIKYDSPNGNMAGGIFVGYPLNSIFGGKLIGVDPATGIYKFKLRSDAIIRNKGDYSDVDNYKFYLGTTDAPVSGGFSTNFSYKRFSLNLSGNYTFGANILNKVIPPRGRSSLSISRPGDSTGTDIQVYYNDLYTYHYNTSKDARQRWTQNNPIISGRGLIVDDIYGDPMNLKFKAPTSSTITDAALMEDISYLRIKNISMSYSVDEKFLKPYKINSLSFSLSLNNFFTFTDYSGIDPESSGAVYPITRSVTFGLSLGF